MMAANARLVDVEAKAADIAAAPVTAAEASGAAPPRGLTRQVDVAVASRIYDTTKFFSVSSAFECMQLALSTDAKAAGNGANTSNGEKAAGLHLTWRSEPCC
jgi:hypothetical protein